MNLLWAPGQSDAAREISHHLNRREKAAIYALSFLFGLCCFAIPMVFMGSFMALGPFQELLEGIAFPVILCLVVGAWSLIALQRRLLLGTQFAKDNGYTLAHINARRPLSRRDSLTIGGIAALAMIIALTAVLAAFLIAA